MLQWAHTIGIWDMQLFGIFMLSLFGKDIDKNHVGLYRGYSWESILGINSLAMSLFGRYILFIVIIFCVLLFITFGSSSFHFSYPALYLTKDTAWEFIALIVFSAFSFKDVNCLTLL